MPLTQAQIDFIYGSIDHLLEFPTDKVELKLGIHHLTIWILHPPTTVDKNNVYLALANCLRHPEKHLQRLEDYGENATIADVTKQLLMLINQSIIKSAELCQSTPTELGWDHHQLLNKLIKCNEETLFITQQHKEETIFPYSDIRDENCIYRAKLVPIGNDGQIDLYINVYMREPDHIIQYKADARGLPGFSNQFNDELELLIGNIEATKKYAREVAFDDVYEYLREVKLIEEEIPEDSIDHFYALFINKLFLDLLISGYIQFDFVKSLTHDDLIKLTHPSTYSLLTETNYPPNSILALSMDELDTINRYLTLLINGKTRLHYFEHLNDSQHKLLRHPIMINLIYQDKLTVKVAAKLNKHYITLLSSPLYDDYFMNLPTKWESLPPIEEYHLDILNDPTIACLIKENILSFSKVTELTFDILHLIRQNPISTLLKAQVLTANQLKKLGITMCRIIQINPDIASALYRRLITIDDIANKHEYDVHALVFTRRLRNYFYNNPCLWENDKTDCIEIFMNELDELNQTRRINIDTFKEMLADNILLTIKNKIEELKLACTSPRLQILLLELYHLVTNKPCHSSLETLVEIAGQANDILCKKFKAHQMTLFSGQSDGDKMMINLCETIVGLSPLGLGLMTKELKKI